MPPEINALISLFEEEEEEEEALVRAFRIGPFFPRTEVRCLINDDAPNLVEERDDDDVDGDVHGDEDEEDEDVVVVGIVLAFLAGGGGASACGAFASRISSFVNLCTRKKEKKNDASSKIFFISFYVFSFLCSSQKHL